MDNSIDFVKNVHKQLQKANIGLLQTVLAFDKLPSTNKKAKELAQDGYEEGTIVIAQKQTHGRGRFTRKWESPSGGLYLSFILRPNIRPEQASLLPLMAAVAVRETVAQLGLSPSIKWPNDVHIDTKKIAGILLESEQNNKKLEYVILGIGINVNIDKHQFPPEIRAVSTSLSEELGYSVEYYPFLIRLLADLDKYYRFFVEGNIATITSEWKQHTDTLGKVILITRPDKIIQGTAIDITDSGFLLIKTDKGNQQIITSGDCTYIQ